VVRPHLPDPAHPRQSTEKYRRNWDSETGSPLLHVTRLQTEVLQRLLPGVPVRFGMQVGNPSVGAVRELIGCGVDRLIVLPMYPHYSATTTASATDTLFASLPCASCRPTTGEGMGRESKDPWSFDSRPCAKKLGKGGEDVTSAPSKPFVGTLWVANPTR
jgi:hypothetical protein